HVAIDDIPPMPSPKDPLGLQNSNDGPPPAMVPSQEPQAERGDVASVAKLPGERALALAAPKPPARPSDVCARNGLRRIEYTQNNHRYWRCLHRQRASSDRQIVSTATPSSDKESSAKQQQPFWGFLFQSTQ